MSWEYLKSTAKVVKKHCQGKKQSRRTAEKGGGGGRGRLRAALRIGGGKNSKWGEEKKWTDLNDWLRN